MERTGDEEGRIRVNVTPDQRIKAGELLAVIDPDSYEIVVRRAEAALELARPVPDVDRLREPVANRQLSSSCSRPA